MKTGTSVRPISSSCRSAAAVPFSTHELPGTMVTPSTSTLGELSNMNSATASSFITPMSESTMTRSWAAAEDGADRSANTQAAVIDHRRSVVRLTGASPWPSRGCD